MERYLTCDTTHAVTAVKQTTHLRKAVGHLHMFSIADKLA